MAFHPVCKAEDLPVGALKAVTAGGEKIVVYHLDDGYYATQAGCPHMFAPLSRGKIIDGHLIQCPLHRARFDIRSGEVVEWANFPPGIQLLNVVRSERALKTFPVKLKAGTVYVKTDEPAKAA